MANSVDPDQTEQSDLDLQFTYANLWETLEYRILGYLPYSERKEFVPLGEFFFFSFYRKPLLFLL